MNILINTLVLAVLLIQLVVYITCIRHPSNRINHNSYEHQFNTHYINRNYENNDNNNNNNNNNNNRNNNDQPLMKEIKSVKYHGHTYTQVLHLKLSFHEAERYCNQAFTNDAHLVSIQSDDEWKMLSKCFGQAGSTKIWLGGTADLINRNYVIFRWFDETDFKYLRFSDKEKEHWQKMLRNHQGCIVGILKNNGQGDWNIQTVLCNEPKEFICEEIDPEFPKKPWDNEKPRPYGYIPSETSFQHPLKIPQFGILSLHQEMYQPKIPVGPKNLFIAPASLEETAEQQPTVENIEQQQVHPSTPPVQQKTNHTAVIRNTSSSSSSSSSRSSERKHDIVPRTKKANNMTEIPASTINAIPNRKVKFVIIKPTDEKTRTEENNSHNNNNNNINNINNNNDMKPVNPVDQSSENQSGPVTIYLQGVSVPNN